MIFAGVFAQFQPRIRIKSGALFFLQKTFVFRTKPLRRHYLKPTLKKHIVYGKNAFIVGEGKNDYRVALVSRI